MPINFLAVFPTSDSGDDVTSAEFEFELWQPTDIDREPASDSGNLCRFLASSQEKWQSSVKKFTFMRENLLSVNMLTNNIILVS